MTSEDYRKAMDFRAITKKSDKIRSRISLYNSDTNVYELFIEAGALTFYSSRKNFCTLTAKLINAVDCDHSVCSAFTLPLTHLEWDKALHDGVAYYYGAISADKYDREQIRLAHGYDPAKVDGAQYCSYDGCQDERHLLLPDGYYSGPPTDPKFANFLSGKLIEIVTHPVVTDAQPC